MGTDLLMKLSVRVIKLAAYVYLLIPIYFFFFGWLRIYYGAIFAVLLAMSIILCIAKNGDGECIRISGLQLMAIVLIAVVWVYMSGIGGFVWQRADFHARNALLHDLIDFKWPVVYEETGRGLVYYLTFFLIPAVVGKLWGFRAATVTLYLIAVIGIVILFMLLAAFFAQDGEKVSNKVLLITMAVTVMYAGLNVLGQLVVCLFGNGSMSLDSIYGWSVYQYTPNNALLEWVFNQAVPAWIGTMLYLVERRKKDLSAFGLISMLMVAHTPMAAVGLAVLMFVDVVKFRGNKLFCLQNICAVCAVLPAFGLYYFCNVAVYGREDAGIGLFRPEGKSLPYLAGVISIFLLVEIGVYIFLIWKRNGHDCLFWAVVIELMLMPLFRIGYGRDFMMRGSIPALFILMVIILQTLFDVEFRRNRIALVLLIASLSIGAYSAVGDFVLTIRNTMDSEITNVADDVHSMGAEYDEWFEDYMYGTPYLVENAGDKVFYKVMGKK